MSITAKWDKEVDAAYFRLNQASVYVSEEIKSGIILDYDRKHNVVGIEILDFSKRFAASRQARVVRKELTTMLEASLKRNKSRGSAKAKSQHSRRKPVMRSHL